jgi:hypothetical protein
VSPDVGAYFRNAGSDWTILEKYVQGWQNWQGPLQSS